MLRGAVAPTVDLMVFTSAAFAHVKSQMNDIVSVLMDFSNPPTCTDEHQLAAALQHLRPVATREEDHERVGSDGDGGYVMLRTSTPECALSIGIGGDSSWDSEMGRRGVRVHMFDHTVTRVPDRVPNGTFHRLGVGPADTGDLRTLSSLASIAGIAEGSRAVLKMDVEGAEWDVLSMTEPGTLALFDQIVLELHGLDGLAGENGQAHRILSALGNLSQHHACVHIHANNNGYCRVARFGSYLFPTVVEVAFVRRSLLSDLRPATRIGCGHDRPCDPNMSDVSLEGLLTLPH